MPHQTATLFNLRSCKKVHPNWRNVPVYRQLLPPVLKNEVKGKTEKTKNGCIQEMSMMMACWQKNEFEERRCVKEIDAFQKCFYRLKDTEQKRIESEARGMAAGSTDLSPKQLNSLFRRYPQPPPTAQ